MRVLIFSDTHLNARFSVRKFKFLKNLILQHDTIIINGDFWDSFHLTFDEFVKTKWKLLFPYFKSRHTIYIYGNHDKLSQANEHVNLFSHVQTKRYRFKVDSKTIIVEHGDRLVPGLDIITKRMGLGSCEPFFKNLDKFYQLNFGVITRLTTKLPFKIISMQNARMKEYARNHLANDEILICGHTHYPEIDLENKFADCGFIKGGYAHYIEIEHHLIKLVETNYL